MKSSVWGMMLCLCLAACATGPVPLHRAQLASLGKSSPAGEVDKAIAQATPLKSFEVQHNSVGYFVRSYNLQTGTDMQMIPVCTPSCIMVMMNVPVFTDYLVIQSLPEKNLFAWGTVEELSKDEDAHVSELMPVLKPKLYEGKKP